MKKIVIAGGSGFLGQALAKSLVAEGYEVVLLGRPRRNSSGLVGRLVPWDAKNPGEWKKELENTQALFNLAGRSIDCRHSSRNRDLILNSRIHATRVLGEAVALCQTPPKVWLNASTASIYPDIRGDAPAHHEDSPGDAPGFLEDVGRAWENEFFQHKREGVRQVAMRISIILGQDGGAFPVIEKFTRLGLGGTQGPGTQWMSWLHLDDWVGLARLLLDSHDIAGPVNLASPEPVTNQVFMREMRKCFAPWGIGLPAPTFGIRIGAIFLGTSPELVLKSIKVSASKINKSGYNFIFTQLRPALKSFISQELANK